MKMTVARVEQRDEFNPSPSGRGAGVRERTRCVIPSPDALFARRPLPEGEARCGYSLRVQLNDVAIDEYMFRPDMLAVEARVAPHARVAQ